MDALLTELAKQSPVAVVAIFSIWRISIVMMVLANALVEVATANSENVSDLVEKQAHN